MMQCFECFDWPCNKSVISSVHETRDICRIVQHPSNVAQVRCKHAINQFWTDSTFAISILLQHKEWLLVRICRKYIMSCYQCCMNFLQHKTLDKCGIILHFTSVENSGIYELPLLTPSYRISLAVKNLMSNWLILFSRAF